MAQQANTGVTLRYTVKNSDGTVRDISAFAAYTITVYIRHRDSDSAKSFTGTMPGGGTDGIVEATTTSTEDLSPAGDQWEMQVRFVSGSDDFSTRPAPFVVRPNLY